MNSSQNINVCVVCVQYKYIILTHPIVFEGQLPHSFICGYSNAFSWLSETQVAEIEINIDFLCLLLLQLLSWAEIRIISSFL